MTPRDDDGRSLTETVRAHADAVRAQLARITALRADSPDIATPAPGLNPLDLGALDPLTPGRFPGIGAAPAAPSRTDPVRPSLSKGIRMTLRPSSGRHRGDGCGAPSQPRRPSRNRRRRRSRSCSPSSTR